jgi:hypothetical protein
VPTSNHVRLHYGTTNVDRLGWLLTLAGVVLLVVLARRPALRMPEPDPSSADRLSRFLTAPTPAFDEYEHQEHAHDAHDAHDVVDDVEDVERPVPDFPPPDG